MIADVEVVSWRGEASFKFRDGLGSLGTLAIPLLLTLVPCTPCAEECSPSLVPVSVLVGSSLWQLSGRILYIYVAAANAVYAVTT